MATTEAPRNVRWSRLLAAFVVSVSVPLLLGALGAVVTTPEIPGWYAGLAKPSWNPPSWLFGPVWTVLYTMMGIAAWRIWKRSISEDLSLSQRAGIRRAAFIYAAQLALNVIWSPVFFALKRTDLALVIIVLLLAAIVVTARSFYRFDRVAAWLLVPYLGWVSFATALNCSIWLLNR